MCSWIAAGTSYSNHGVAMVPFYIYYSMFGFQRVGDFCWAAGDMQARGFLIGGTTGRTTLAGEGLQHQDGHSQLLSTTVPNCVSYDPTYAYELAVIVQDGLRRMYVEQENVFYYVTCMNENYVQPAMPKGVEEGILKGMYLLHVGGRGKVRVNLLGCGTILREVLAAADILEKEFGVPADVFSATSLSELRREALDAERWTCCTPTIRRECRTYGNAWRVMTARSWPRRITCGRSGPDRQWVSAAITCSAPTDTAAAIRARRCAASSRSTGATSSSPRSRLSRTTASSTSPREGDRAVRNRSGQAEPVTV